jgi:serine/threonine protein kinase/TolB-like protein
MIDALLSHYRLERQIGAGGMGVVYRAYDTKLQRHVAIKLLHDAPDQSGRSRLVQEARAASVLNHHNICVIHEVEDTGECAFIVMEYAEGRPLRELLPRDGLPVETVVRYGIQIADALTHAHQRGVIHRDLKSLNVVITPDGLAKVLDFGLARRLQQEELEQITHSQASTAVVSTSNRSLIGLGQCVGTLPYMPPEMLRGEIGDERSDLWSFGVLLYEMATGTLPFRGKTAFELSAAILRETPIPLPSAVPAGLRSVILRSLTKEALQRYRNAGEVRVALETVQRDLESPSPHPSRLHAVAQSIRRRSAWKTTLAGAASLVAIVALTFALPVSRRLVLPSSSSLLRARIAAGQQAVGVFPFRPLAGEAHVGHIAGGLTESLAARLSPSKALRIAPVGAVERAIRKSYSIEQAARELGLDMMVTGTVRQIAGRLRINVNINDAKSGQRLWTEEMSADRSDLLTLEGRLHNRVMETIYVEPASKHAGVEASRPRLQTSRRTTCI